MTFDFAAHWALRGQDIARLQRVIHRQRSHIRALRSRLRAVDRDHLAAALDLHRMASLKQQNDRLLATVQILKQRNLELEALRQV